MTAPRIGPGGRLLVAGPEVEYEVVGLDTTGATARLLLRTVDGRDWHAERGQHDTSSTTYVLRRHDEEARRAWLDDPAPESLQAARLGIEHVEHHGRPLRFVGSSYGAQAIHRFACWDEACPFVLAWSVAP